MCQAALSHVPASERRVLRRARSSRGSRRPYRAAGSITTRLIIPRARRPPSRLPGRLPTRTSLTAIFPKSTRLAENRHAAPPGPGESPGQAHGPAPDPRNHRVPEHLRLHPPGGEQSRRGGAAFPALPSRTWIPQVRASQAVRADPVVPKQRLRPPSHQDRGPAQSPLHRTSHARKERREASRGDGGEVIQGGARDGGCVQGDLQPRGRRRLRFGPRGRHRARTIHRARALPRQQARARFPGRADVRAHSGEDVVVRDANGAKRWREVGALSSLRTRALLGVPRRGHARGWRVRAGPPRVQTRRVRGVSGRDGGGHGRRRGSNRRGFARRGRRAPSRVGNRRDGDAPDVHSQDHPAHVQGGEPRRSGCAFRGETARGRLPGGGDAVAGDREVRRYASQSERRRVRRRVGRSRDDERRRRRRRGGGF